MMLGRTRHALCAACDGLLEDEERPEVMVHLLAGSGRWVLRNFRAINAPWQPLGTVQYAVLTDRRLLILGADATTGRPRGPLLFGAPRHALELVGVGGRFITWVELETEAHGSFRLFVPVVGRTECRNLVRALNRG
jgi:hypothetical protein